MGDGAPQLRFMDLLDAADARRLVTAAASRSFAAGTAIITVEDPPGEMFIILAGHGRVSVVSGDGKEVSYRDLRPGDVFGELALLDGQPRSAYVTAVTDVAAIALTRAAYARLVAAHPGIGLAMNRHLAAQVRSLSTRVLEVSTLLVRARLVRELSRRAVRPAADSDRGEIRPAPAHADLASRIGTHREAVTKELSRLAREGHVVRGDGVLIIPSLSGLPY